MGSTNEAELREAVAALDDERLHALLGSASGPDVDAILQGVKFEPKWMGLLHPNKLFGKGLRAPRRQQLEQRLRDVVAFAASSAVARDIRTRAASLEVRGAGLTRPPAIDVSSLSEWPALRRLTIMDAQGVIGLAKVTQVAELSISAAEVDLGDLTAMPALEKLIVDARQYHWPASFGASGPYAELVVVVHPGTTISGCRTKLLRVVSQDGVADFGPVQGQITELNVHTGSDLERVTLAPLPELRTMVCSSVSKLHTIEGLSGCPGLRELSLEGAFQSLEFLRGLALEVLSVGAQVSDMAALAAMPSLRRLTFEGPSAIAAFGSLPDLSLEHLGFHRSYIDQESVYENWKSTLRNCARLRSLALRGYALESLHEVPPLPELETLDLSHCRGFLELDGATHLFPRLRKLVLTGTAMLARDLPPSLKSSGVEIVR